jgi:carbonic anhydrase/acetyltransferase-like protein (isoleucine patch superfamily)
MATQSFDGIEPQVASTAFVAASADLIGRVTIANRACVLFGAVLRGDTEHITVGEGSNIQDGVVVHADPGVPARIGSGVSVGHNATLHGCTIADNVLIGMGATVLNGASIGEGSLIAAGSVVLEGQVIPPRSLVAGIPASVKRELSDEEYHGVVANAEHYVALAEKYRAQN